jgi:Contractile injection system tube protein
VPLVKAIVEILDPAAIDPRRGLLRFIPVQFNPTEYTVDKGAQLAEITIPGIDSPILQFVRGQNERLSLDLFFDTTSLGMDEVALDVRVLTNSIYQLVKMQPRTHAPPRIRLVWGLGLSFKAVVESVQQRFTLFNPLGIPVRATATVGLREYKTLEEQLAELNLQSPDHTRTRVIRRRDTLGGIAATEYGDPTRWREIADANPVATRELRRLPPGERLTIPPLEGRAAAGAGVA